MRAMNNLLPPRRGRSDDRETGRAGRSYQYLADGRLTIEAIDGNMVRATCHGFRDSYELGYEPGLGWWCSCGSSRRCAHVMALELVTQPAVAVS
ncbi:MAG TPA: hypothetical protein DIT48_08995 [Actinobacteria bacterium]|jgi:hypothetical protein|nr:hypothetical protein [Actinomycetota bacterium]HCP62791.1 hypothetical protein [Actinomycetota bacterium]